MFPFLWLSCKPGIKPSLSTDLTAHLFRNTNDKICTKGKLRSDP